MASVHLQRIAEMRENSASRCSRPRSSARRVALVPLHPRRRGRRDEVSSGMPVVTTVASSASRHRRSAHAARAMLLLDRQERGRRHGPAAAARGGSARTGRGFELTFMVRATRAPGDEVNTRASGAFTEGASRRARGRGPRRRLRACFTRRRCSRRRGLRTPRQGVRHAPRGPTMDLPLRRQGRPAEVSAEVGEARRGRGRAAVMRPAAALASSPRRRSAPGRPRTRCSRRRSSRIRAPRHRGGRRRSAAVVRCSSPQASATAPTCSPARSSAVRAAPAPRVRGDALRHAQFHLERGSRSPRSASPSRPRRARARRRSRTLRRVEPARPRVAPRSPSDARS